MSGESFSKFIPAASSLERPIWKLPATISIAVETNPAAIPLCVSAPKLYFATHRSIRRFVEKSGRLSKGRSTARNISSNNDTLSGTNKDLLARAIWLGYAPDTNPAKATKPISCGVICAFFFAREGLGADAPVTSLHDHPWTCAQAISNPQPTPMRWLSGAWCRKFCCILWEPFSGQNARLVCVLGGSLVEIHPASRRSDGNAHEFTQSNHSESSLFATDQNQPDGNAPQTIFAARHRECRIRGSSCMPKLF